MVIEMTDYKGSWVEEIVTYELVFYYERGCGLGFPCDEHGNVDRSQLMDAAIANLDYALAHPEKYPVAFNEVEKHVGRYRNPPSGVCECGKHIEIHNEYLGAGECPHCGRWHNLFGDLLNDPRTWRDGDDWCDEE